MTKDFLTILFNAIILGLLIFAAHNFYCLLVETMKAIRSYINKKQWKQNILRKISDITPELKTPNPSGRKRPEEVFYDD